MFSKKIVEKTYDLRLETDRQEIEVELVNFDTKWGKLKKVDKYIGGAVTLTMAAIATRNVLLILAAGGFIGLFMTGKMTDASRKPLEKDLGEQLAKLKFIYACCLKNNGVEATKDETFLKVLNAIFPFVDKDTELDFLLPKHLRSHEKLKAMSRPFKAVFSELPAFRLNDFVLTEEPPVSAIDRAFSYIANKPTEKLIDLSAASLPKPDSACQKVISYFKSVGHFAYAKALPLVYGTGAVEVDEKPEVKSVKKIA